VPKEARWSHLKDNAPQLAAAVGEDGRQAGEACALLLAAAGRESPDATPVRSDAPVDLGAADAKRVALRLRLGNPAPEQEGRSGV
jgi:hypothetical protein